MKQFCSILYFLCLIFTLALVSCEKTEVINPPVPDGDDMEITVSIRTDSPASTYAMSPQMENHIQEVDVLVFKVGSDNKEYFAYRSKGRAIDEVTGSNYLEKTFEVTLRKDISNTYRFVVIANAREVLDNFGYFAAGAEKELILEKVISNVSTAWKTNSLSDFHPIPMWGESGLSNVDDDLVIDNVQMLRSLARIDVISHVTTDNFKLKEVHIYNRSGKGRVVPLPDAITWNPFTIKPSLPAGDNVTILGPLQYTVTGSNTEFCNSIYVYEAKAAPSGEDLNATCLVIGGEYDNSGVTTYYRADFVEGYTVDGETIFRDLLRNFIYEMNINSVSGAGESTSQEAFEKKRAQMDIEIVTWDLSSVTANIGYDEELTVSRSNFTIDVTGCTNKEITVKSTSKSAWTVTTSVPWISAIRSSSTLIKFNVEANNTGAPRTGYIRIYVDNLIKSIKVTQND